MVHRTSYKLIFIDRYYQSELDTNLLHKTKSLHYDFNSENQQLAIRLRDLKIFSLIYFYEYEGPYPALQKLIALLSFSISCFILGIKAQRKLGLILKKFNNKKVASA